MSRIELLGNFHEFIFFDDTCLLGSCDMCIEIVCESRYHSRDLGLEIVEVLYIVEVLFCESFYISKY